ncbi:MAG: septum formation protein Maf [Gammaproteobacteria bacterium]|nr:septum formation protein Maf [Gammaproteobacteria bacterium]
MIKIYLASKSPRRRALLEQMNISFDILNMDIPEIQRPHETPEQYSYRITHEKLQSAWDFMQNQKLDYRPILCADTEVILDGKILGKPKDRNDAFSMLKNYANREHLVLTSVGLRTLKGEQILQHRTIVEFDNLSDVDINHYLDSDDYMDKAGAYGIQSSIGQFIKNINGCFYSVMGLPLHLVRTVLNTIVQKD